MPETTPDNIIAYCTIWLIFRILSYLFSSYCFETYFSILNPSIEYDEAYNQFERPPSTPASSLHKVIPKTDHLYLDRLNCAD